MHPSFHLPSSHAENVYERLPSRPPEPALSEVECQALLAQVNKHTKDVSTLQSFLQSNDPGAKMEESLQATLLSQCHSLADTRYLEDVWPAAAAGNVTVPPNTPAPAFQLRHQAQTQQNAAQLDTLTELVIDMSKAKLEVLLGPLKHSVEEVENLVNMLMHDSHPTAYALALGFIDCIEKRKGAGTLEGCWIAGVARDLSRHQHSLDNTREALKVLIQLRVGNGDGVSFSMARHPDFHNEWKLAVSDMDNQVWPSFKRRVDKLTQWREQLLPDAPPVNRFKV